MKIFGHIALCVTAIEIIFVSVTISGTVLPRYAVLVCVFALHVVSQLT